MMMSNFASLTVPSRMTRSTLLMARLIILKCKKLYSMKGVRAVNKKTLTQMSRTKRKWRVIKIERLLRSYQ
jgi:hypothetical protein